MDYLPPCEKTRRFTVEVKNLGEVEGFGEGKGRKEEVEYRDSSVSVGPLLK